MFNFLSSWPCDFSAIHSSNPHWSLHPRYRSLHRPQSNTCAWQRQVQWMQWSHRKHLGMFTCKTIYKIHVVFTNKHEDVSWFYTKTSGFTKKSMEFTTKKFRISPTFFHMFQRQKSWFHRPTIVNITNSVQFFPEHVWLVIDLPLWKIMELGWWHSQYMDK